MKSCCKDAFNEDPDWEKEEEREPRRGLTALKDRWKVKSVRQVILILCTFAVGGTLCGIAGKQIMHHIGPDHKGLWLFIYVLLVTVLWPSCVLLVSIFFGQFTFFKYYLKMLGKKLTGKK